MVILGLDVSTSCVGYAFTENKKILDMGFIDIKKQSTPKEKTFYVLEYLSKNKYIDDIEKINIEDNLSGFAGGRTSQQTIVKLAKFNAVLGFVVEEEFRVEVENINPMTARKKVFGKARVKGVKSKDYVKMKIEEMYDTEKWCVTTSRGNFDHRNIDSYDALVMSLCD
jgi:RNase H-fold protein (predicted Holliday junction resolvase)